MLARRLHKGSKDTDDQALKELAGIGPVVVERRRSGRQNLTNRYHLRSTPPVNGASAIPAAVRAQAGGRIPAASVAADRARDGSPQMPGYSVARYAAWASISASQPARFARPVDECLLC